MQIQVELPPKVPVRWARDYPLPDLLQFNVNDWVRVKLTQHGFDVHKREYEHFWWAQGRKPPYKYEPPKVDSYGFSRFQTWEFLQKFGGAFEVCAANVIEGNNLYFERAAMRSESRGTDEA